MKKILITFLLISSSIFAERDFYFENPNKKIKEIKKQIIYLFSEQENLDSNVSFCADMLKINKAINKLPKFNPWETLKLKQMFGVLIKKSKKRKQKQQTLKKEDSISIPRSFLISKFDKKYAQINKVISIFYKKLFKMNYEELLNFTSEILSLEGIIKKTTGISGFSPQKFLILKKKLNRLEIEQQILIEKFDY